MKLAPNATGYCCLISLLNVVLAITDFHKKTTINYTIGFLPSMRKGDGRKYVGAFEYAIRRVNAGLMLHNNGKTRLLKSLNNGTVDYGLTYNNQSVEGDTFRSLRLMTEQYMQGTVAFIGPEDTCYFEAKVAAAWNLPMIAYAKDSWAKLNHSGRGLVRDNFMREPSDIVHDEKCTDYRISEKKSFPTFVRTFAPTDKISKSIIAVLTKYNWMKFTPIASEMPKWQATARTLIQLAKEIKPEFEPQELQSFDMVQWHNVHIGEWQKSRRFSNNKTKGISKYDKFRNPSSRTYNERNYSNIPTFHETTAGKMRKKLEKIIDETKATTRVYVFLGDRTEFVHFVRSLDSLVDRDKRQLYAVIAANDEQDDFSPQLFEEKTRRLETLKAHSVLAFRNALVVKPSKPLTNTKSLQTFLKQSKLLANEVFGIPTVPRLPGYPVPFDQRYAMAVYDAVYVYARALHDVLEAGGDPANGTDIFDRIKGNGFRSISGHLVPIDEDADAEGNFSVLALKPNTSSPFGWNFQRVGGLEKRDGKDVFLVTEDIEWIGDPPLDEPRCGFHDDKCDPDTTSWSLISVIAGAIVILLVGTVFAVRHYLYEQKLASLLWKIDYKDIMITTMDDAATQSGRCKRKVSPQYSFLSAAPSEDQNDNKPRLTFFCEVGSYKGQVVAINRLRKKQIELNRIIKKELQQMKEMNHDNVNRFVGAVVEPNHICIITQYCNRGSLQDILQKDDYKLDGMFKASLIIDLIKGMSYLHDSEIISHGRLKSSNCLVDSRWVLQISGFGLNNFKSHENHTEYDDEESAYRELLWTAPELLRQAAPSRSGTQKGDVYSFAIILHEITARKGPWGYMGGISAKEIVRRVRCMPGMDLLSASHFRPDTTQCDTSESQPGFVKECMEECWSEDPEARPEFKFIRIKLKDLNKGLRSNIFDNMVALMEKYSSNLEAQVEERTQQLSDEKKKTDALLHRMLPKSVAEQLKTGMTVKPEHYEEVTIYFSDICGFTEMAARSTPMKVVDLLNKLYSLFDSTIGNYDVYKVETIGDAYMVVSGLPIRNGDIHAGEIASMSLSLLQSINSFNREKKHTELIKLRIGIHSGPCVAGVVGHKMPRYCLFGDTVNTSSRMESTGVALKIHCSERCKLILAKLGGYTLVERGQVNVKGKGMMRTYFLEGENPTHRLRRISRDKLSNPLVNQQLGQLSRLNSSSDSLLSTYQDEQDDTINSVRVPLLTNGFMSRRSVGSDNILMNIQLLNGSAVRAQENGGDIYDLKRQASTEFMV